MEATTATVLLLQPCLQISTVYESDVASAGGAALQWQNGYQTITGDAASNDLTYRTYQNHIWKNTTGASSTTDGTEVMRISGSNVVLAELILQAMSLITLVFTSKGKLELTALLTQRHYPL